MKRIIINADDFGLTKKVSDAIIDVYKKGNLSSTTLMVNMSGTDYAIQQAKENPELGIGLHFNITEGKSMLGNSSLTDNNGAFFGKIPLNKKVSLNKFNLIDVKNELIAQFEFLFKNGINISHIDSHQHIHMNPKIFPLVADFAKSKNVNIRIAFPQVLKRKSGGFNFIKRTKQLVLKYAANKNAKYADKARVKYNKSFNSIFDFHPFQMPKANDYKELIEKSLFDNHELMIHPYILSDELKEIYEDKYDVKEAFFEKAVAEYNALMSFNKGDVELITFSDL